MDSQADRQGRSILKQMSKHCLNNFYGECFSGNLRWNEIKTLGERPAMEVLLYKAAFKVRSLL